MNAYIENIKAKPANEPEFVQTVEEVLPSLEPVIEKHPEYEKADLLNRMVEPERTIWKMRVEASEKYGLGYNLVAVTNITGLQRVVDAMMAQVFSPNLSFIKNSSILLFLTLLCKKRLRAFPLKRFFARTKAVVIRQINLNN